MVTYLPPRLRPFLHRVSAVSSNLPRPSPPLAGTPALRPLSPDCPDLTPDLTSIASRLAGLSSL
jgi:hypothetical protein